MERLSGLDASFLYLETPSHHMHVCMTMVMDPATMPGGYSFAAIKELLRSKQDLPLFRRRIAPVPFGLAHPVWVDDPHFDLDYHVRRIGAPAPGGRRELAELAAQIAGIPLDRDRPLWQMWVIEGLKQGRIGVVTKVHHAAIDGVSGADMMMHLFDLSADGGGRGAAADMAALTGDPTPPSPAEAPRDDHIPNDLELVGYALRSRARRAAQLVPLLRATVESVTHVVQGRRDPGHHVGAVPLTAPRLPWNESVTPHRAVGFARVSLDDVKEVRRAFDVKINDVVLALCAGTLRHYLAGHGAVPDEPLLAVCPISVHDGTERESVNQVSAMFVSLATDIDDIGERLAAISESTKGAKDEHNAVGAETLIRWAEYAPPNTFNLASRLYSSLSLASRHRPIHNAIISNVPGPPFPLYFGGAEMVATYPMGPVMEGCGLNITVFSYQDQVDIGFMVCRELIPDVWAMADDVDTAMAELLAAARARTGATKEATTKKAGQRAPAKKQPAKKQPAKKARKRAPAKKTATKRAPRKAPAKSARTTG